MVGAKLRDTVGLRLRVKLGFVFQITQDTGILFFQTQQDTGISSFRPNKIPVYPLLVYSLPDPTRYRYILFQTIHNADILFQTQQDYRYIFSSRPYKIQVFSSIPYPTRYRYSLPDPTVELLCYCWCAFSTIMMVE